MADNKPTSWEYNKNSPIDNYGTIVNGGSAITTITPTNPTGYSRLDPDSNDGIVRRIFYSIDINGKVTYAEGDSNGELRTRPDGTPIKQFNNIQEIANDRIPGYNNSTTLLLKNALSKNLKDRYKAIVIDNTDDASPYAKSGPNQPNNNGTDPSPKTLQIDEIKLNTADPEYEDLVYPTGLGNFGQDFIMFTAYSYGGRTFRPGANLSETQSLGIGTRDFGERNGSVSLPIQPSITDSNTVQWGSENLNPITAFAASLSLGAMSDPTKSFNEALGAAERQIKENKNLDPSVRLYLAGKAVGVNGLLSRIGGGILNPNMELLFQGPQLRPFTFVFRLSARQKTEADTIRKIIRYFKQNMAVKTTIDNLFLKAPNIFEIHYKQRGRNKSEDHPSLNKIKKCALQSCIVDYTPDGSYMTFNDENNTMVSYNLTLQFQELEPVTSGDYDNKILDQIGY